MYRFDSVTIFIFATTETDLLSETIRQIRSSCDDADLSEIIVVVPSADFPSYRHTQKLIEQDITGKLSIYLQKNRMFELFMAELPPLVKGSHFVFMAADLEMDPTDIQTFIQKAKLHPHRIIAASKWLPESTVIGYGKMRRFCSRTLNWIVRHIIQSDATDLFTIYQMYPLSVYHEMHFDDPRYFAYEYSLRPVRLGYEYEEIPTVYRKRTEGKTHFNLFALFRVAFIFIFSAVRVRRTAVRNDHAQ